MRCFQEQSEGHVLPAQAMSTITAPLTIRGPDNTISRCQRTRGAVAATATNTTTNNHHCRTCALKIHNHHHHHILDTYEYVLLLFIPLYPYYFSHQIFFYPVYCVQIILPQCAALT